MTDTRTFKCLLRLLRWHRFIAISLEDGNFIAIKGNEVLKGNFKSKDHLEFDGQILKYDNLSEYLCEREAQDEIVMLRIFIPRGHDTTSFEPEIWVREESDLSVEGPDKYFRSKDYLEMRCYMDLEIKDCSISKEQNFELLYSRMENIFSFLVDKNLEIDVLEQIGWTYDYEFVKELVIKLKLGTDPEYNLLNCLKCRLTREDDDFCDVEDCE
jgi:hypothetical protein